MHQQLSDTYTAIYESYFAKLKSPLALRFFCRFPVPQDLAGHYAAMLASVLFDLANGKLGPHKGNRRLVVLQAKAEHILAFSKPWHRFEWRRELWRWNSKPNSSVNCAVSCWPTTSVLPASSACCVINCYPPRNRPSQRPRASARSCRHHSRRNRHRHAVPLARGVCRL